MAGWEIRVGALGGGLPVRAFRQVAICTVVPLVPTGVCFGGFLLERVLGAPVGCFWMRLWNCGLWSWCVVMGGWECPSFDQRWLGTVC